VSDSSSNSSKGCFHASHEILQNAIMSDAYQLLLTYK
jgi:hypothetical protein